MTTSAKAHEQFTNSHSTEQRREPDEFTLLTVEEVAAMLKVGKS